MAGLEPSSWAQSSASRLSSRSRSASARAASWPRSRSMPSLLLISLLRASRAERGVRVAVLGGLAHVADQPDVRRQRVGPHLVIEIASAGRPAARPRTAPSSALRYRSGYPVERGDRRVRRLRPGRRVLGPGPGPHLARGVVTVVAGQIQVGEVEERIGPVQLEFAEGDLGQPLESGQVGLVIAVLLPIGRPVARAAASASRPARTPAGDRSWTLPSYSWRPPYSRTSGTDRSRTARNLGLISVMLGNLSDHRPRAVLG